MKCILRVEDVLLMPGMLIQNDLVLCIAFCVAVKDSDKLGETHHNILWEFVQTCSELEYFLLQTVFVIQTSTYFTDCQIF